MDTSQSKTTWLIAVVLLLAGIAAGYYFGFSRGKTAGFAEGKAAEQKAQEELLSKTTAGAAINPVANLPSANPFEETKTNPFKEAYKNPFR